MSSEFDSLKGKTIYINGIPYEVESINEPSPSDPVSLGMKGKDGGGSFNSGSIPRESLKQASKQPIPSLDLPNEPKEIKSSNTPDTSSKTDPSKTNQLSPTKDSAPSQTATQPTPNTQNPGNDTSPQPQTDQSPLPNQPQPQSTAGENSKDLQNPTPESASQAEPTIQSPIGPSVPSQQPQPSPTSPQSAPTSPPQPQSTDNRPQTTPQTSPTPLHNQPAPKINNFSGWRNKLFNANNGNQAPAENSENTGLLGKAKNLFNPLKGKKKPGAAGKAVEEGKKVAKRGLETGEKIGKEGVKDVVKIAAEDTLIATVEIWGPIAIVSVIVIFIIFFIVGSVGGGGSSNSSPTLEQQKEIEASMVKDGMTQEEINALKKKVGENVSLPQQNNIGETPLTPTIPTTDTIGNSTTP